MGSVGGLAGKSSGSLVVAVARLCECDGFAMSRSNKDINFFYVFRYLFVILIFLYFLFGY